MAGRALRWFDVPAAIGLTLIGYRAAEITLAPAAAGIPLVVRAVTVAIPGALAFAVISFLTSYYHEAQSVRTSLQRAVIGVAMGAVFAVSWMFIR